ncbi:MAG TPA: DUF4349 domain-containing protein [Mycobacteriales bacterium]|jgi:hypothetical protein|nr:DUF4349 domain-containing protein [Mycobacteriales bacterium]
MIAEDLLERGLADLANDYDVPDGAVDRVREQLAPSVEDDVTAGPRTRRLYRPTTRGWLVMAAAALVIIVIASFAVGGSHTSAPIQHLAAAPLAGGERGPTGDGSTAAGSAPVPNAARLTPQKGVNAGAAPDVNANGGAVGTGLAIGGSTGSSSDSTNGPITPVPSVPDKIIKTGELDLQVPKGQVGTTLDQLTGLATLERGYIANSRTSEGGFAPSGQVTLRVPVATFDDTVKRARTIKGVKVLNLQTSSKDVTSKFVDLKARISALDKTRKTFLLLLTRATTIGETLAVQQHITDVQTQIEQLQGQKKVLANQAALSTLTITVDQKAITETVPVHHKSGLHKALDRSVSRFVHGIEAIIGILGPVLLVLLIVGLGWLAARFGYRRLRRRMV